MLGFRTPASQMNVPLSIRVKAIAPVINEMIRSFQAGEIQDGDAFFQDVLVEKIRSANLLEDNVFIQVEQAGVHIDNREGTGMVPMDVHDLLLRIFQDGLNMKMVDCLATWIPESAEGQKWRDFNERLALESNGLLPPVQKSFLKIVTVRGSHTTGAVRCVKLGARGVHEQVCNEGHVSRSKSTDRVSKSP